MGAIIDHDYISAPDERNRLGLKWGGGVQNKATALRFRLRDDDGITYYAGAIDRDDVFGDSDEDLLYDIQQWGEYDAGTVSVELRANLLPAQFVQRHRECRAVSHDDWVAPYGLPSVDKPRKD